MGTACQIPCCNSPQSYGVCESPWKRLITSHRSIYRIPEGGAKNANTRTPASGNLSYFRARWTFEVKSANLGREAHRTRPCSCVVRVLYRSPGPSASMSNNIRAGHPQARCRSHERLRHTYVIHHPRTWSTRTSRSHASGRSVGKARGYIPQTSCWYAELVFSATMNDPFNTARGGNLRNSHPDATHSGCSPVRDDGGGVCSFLWSRDSHHLVASRQVALFSEAY
ncbi:hypothetical protein OH77DRAFT_1015529 [Trametes cingulata]|nr:hypothetical protein OH77DRAFT_1015529 [Trametes cingulata]